MQVLRTKAFGLVEVVIAISIFTTAFLSLSVTYQYYLRHALANETTVKGAFLLEEGIEAIKIMRDNGWTSKIASLTVNQTYYLYFNNTTWVSTTTAETIGDFSRSFKLAPVYRDGNSDIASSGTLDSNIKKATVTLSWFDAGTTTVKSMTTYITNLFSN
jgi:hypothetical protein